MTDRRTFIATLAGPASAPRAVLAQKRTRTPRLGMLRLSPARASDVAQSAQPFPKRGEIGIVRNEGTDVNISTFKWQAETLVENRPKDNGFMLRFGLKSGKCRIPPPDGDCGVRFAGEGAGHCRKSGRLSGRRDSAVRRASVLRQVRAPAR